MKLLQKFSSKSQRDIYYYNTKKVFDVEDFAWQLLNLILEEQEATRKKGVVFFCIGTDRSTGDSLGPLIGYKLKEKKVRKVEVIGTLEAPVHAMNLEIYMDEVRYRYKDYVVVAVDASVGSQEHIGYITLGRGALKPGLGVSKELQEVGDLFITGVVGKCGNYDPLMLQSVRLSVVMKMADCISEGIYVVEKLWRNTTLI